MHTPQCKRCAWHTSCTTPRSLHGCAYSYLRLLLIVFFYYRCSSVPTDRPTAVCRERKRKTNQATKRYQVQVRSLHSAGWVGPIARYIVCEITWRRWEQPIVAGTTRSSAGCRYRAGIPGWHLPASLEDHYGTIVDYCCTRYLARILSTSRNQKAGRNRE